MHISRRSLSLFFATLAVFSSGVFLYPEKASAQEVMPLPVAEQIIEQQKKKVENKEDILVATTDEVENLEAKKTSLSTELQTIKSDVERLKQEIADKKAAEEAERKRVEAERKLAAERKRKELRYVVVRAARYASSGNTYQPGQCTWYVKNMRPDLPNRMGDASNWYYAASSAGLSVGYTPRVGAAATRKIGNHVVYVTGVNGDGTITVSEMNYNYIPYSQRTTTKNASDFYYIY